MSDGEGALSVESGIDVFDAVIGQDVAVARLRAAADAPVHAYLFLGPRGTGSRQAALGFAGLLLSDGSDGSAADRHRRLAINGIHPDLVIVEPQGVQFRDDEAMAVIKHASTSPVEGARKVIVIDEAHTMNATSIGRLLKVIEEPSPAMHFVLLAEEVPPEMITIASRCVTIEFSPVAGFLIETALFAAGVEPRRAKAAAAASGGNLDRARLLATDDALANRAELWRSVPDRLDGTGSTAVELVNEIRSAMDGAQEPLEAKHVTELEELEARVELTGERGSGRADLVAKQKREIRRLRSDELRFGLATLSRAARDRLVVGPDPGAEEALAAIRQAVDALIRNPNEALLLQHLLLSMGASGARTEN